MPHTCLCVLHFPTPFELTGAYRCLGLVGSNRSFLCVVNLQAGEMKQGSWDGRGSWNNEPEDPEYRPIGMFRGHLLFTAAYTTAASTNSIY